MKKVDTNKYLEMGLKKILERPNFGPDSLTSMAKAAGEINKLEQAKLLFLSKLKKQNKELDVTPETLRISGSKKK